MKHLMSLVCCLLLMACQDNADQKRLEKDLLGRWKIYQVRYGKKDISKSSDPGNENGIDFYDNNTYYRFGNLGFQDTGRYSLEEGCLVFTSEKDSLKQYTLIDLERDTLKIIIPLEKDDTLKMSLYKMER